MLERAIVRKIEGDIFKLGCSDVEGCKSCASSFCSVKERVFEAVNPKDINIREGDVVEVYLAPGKAVTAGFLVLIVPLMLFAAAYLIAGRLFTEASEGIRAVSGLIGLAVGFALSFTYSKKRKAASMPAIVSVYENNGDSSKGGP